MFYVVQVITSEEAERRGQKYDAEGMTYLFDLDYDDMDDCHFTVDAGFYGNVSHFVNHSVSTSFSHYSTLVQLCPVPATGDHAGDHCVQTTK